MLEISTISLVLRAHEIVDIFNIFDEIYSVFTLKKSISSISFAFETKYSLAKKGEREM